MTKLNPTIYKKLFAQAEEAKEQGLTKLASSIFEAIGAYAEEESAEYTFEELQADVERDLWKVSSRLLRYYDLESLDASVLDREIVSLASELVESLKVTIGADSIVVGPLEPKVPGQTE